MSERGGEDGKNPFSFKSFVKKSKDSDESDEDNVAEQPSIVPNLPDIGLSADVASKEDSKPTKKDHNPFSFKKFLQTDSSSRPPPPNYKQDYTSDLPDFVQDHYTIDKSRARAGRETASPLDSIPNPLDSIHGVHGGTLDHVSDADNDPLVLDPNVVDPLDDILFPHGPGSSNGNHEPLPGAINGLPDFVSDSKPARLFCDSGSDEEFVSTNVQDDNKRLVEENKNLRAQLREAQQFAERESKRVAAVLQEMESIQKKEAEETAALENMIHNVEANHKITTQRAVKAEKTIVKLQQEIKTLQGQVKQLQTENQALATGMGIGPIREKTKQASEQLATAAHTAEQSLKQLLSGVDNLKVLSQVLASVDKIVDSEPKPPQTDPS